MDTYSICYNMCTQRTPYNWSEELYKRHGETVASYLQVRSARSAREEERRERKSGARPPLPRPFLPARDPLCRRQTLRPSLKRAP